MDSLCSLLHVGEAADRDGRIKERGESKGRLSDDSESALRANEAGKKERDPMSDCSNAARRRDQRTNSLVVSNPAELLRARLLVLITSPLGRTTVWKEMLGRVSPSSV